MRIYSKNDAVNVANEEYLRSKENPVIVIKAKHPPGWFGAEASFKEAGNLHAELTICIGARVMLLHNFWVEAGLVNGALCDVKDIVWGVGADPRRDLPLAILVTVDGYDGPSLYPTDGKPVVPIFTQTRPFYRGSSRLTRTQFPITLARAATIHKAQGDTVDELVVNLNHQEFVAGLSYVAVSRVKTLQGLIIEEPINYEHIRNLKPRPSQVLLEKDIQRREQDGEFI